MATTQQPMTYVRIGDLKTFSFTHADDAVALARHFRDAHKQPVTVTREAVTLLELKYEG
jgi:hypothetical protein